MNNEVRLLKMDKKKMKRELLFEKHSTIETRCLKSYRNSHYFVLFNWCRSLKPLTNVIFGKITLSCRLFHGLNFFPASDKQWPASF